MYGSKHISNVALFPLCDASSVLTDALSDSTDAPNTRGDALVFAWRLSLPARMSVAQAANAVLVVAMSRPREAWSRQQLLIVRELMVLGGREAPASAEPDQSLSRQKRTVSVSREATAREGTAAKRKATPKEAKEWWSLVGRGEQRGKQLAKRNNKSSSDQRKTRNRRVSREP